MDQLIIYIVDSVVQGVYTNFPVEVTIVEKDHEALMETAITQPEIISLSEVSQDFWDVLDKAKQRRKKYHQSIKAK